MTEPITREDFALLPEDVRGLNIFVDDVRDETHIWFTGVTVVDLGTILRALIASQKDLTRAVETIDQMWKDHDKEQDLQNYLEKFGDR